MRLLLTASLSCLALAAPAAAHPPAVPRALAPLARIPLTGPFAEDTKDPGFVDDGRPVAGARWIAFGDLRRFFLKAFDVRGGRLAFRPGERAIAIRGLPARLDSPWAPQVWVDGGTAWLAFAAGAMPPNEGPRWATYRLRLASAPVARLSRELRGRGAVTFDDRGRFGPDPGEAVIDPHFYRGPDGRATLSYTVVRHGIADLRWHEEFVRAVPVDPHDPRRALGPEVAAYDGRARTSDDGVAEAQDVAWLGGRPWTFVSVRAGDKDQLILVGPGDPGRGRLDRARMVPFLRPAGAGFAARAVGSSGVATIGGRSYLVCQGLDARGQFGLGWCPVGVR